MTSLLFLVVDPVPHAVFTLLYVLLAVYILMVRAVYPWGFLCS